MSEWAQIIFTAGAIGSALIGGLLFAFSAFIMKAFSKIPAAEGIRAMQSINIYIINPLFFAVFFGTALLAVVSVMLYFTSGQSLSHWVWVGSLNYLLGPIFLTIVGNVPLNNRLAAVDPESEEGQRLWSFYLKRWTLLNHIRTAASLFASYCYIHGIANL